MIHPGEMAGVRTAAISLRAESQKLEILIKKERSGEIASNLGSCMIL
jgi:hypothetical protein